MHGPVPVQNRLQGNPGKGGVAEKLRKAQAHGVAAAQLCVQTGIRHVLLTLPGKGAEHVQDAEKIRKAAFHGR